MKATRLQIGIALILVYVVWGSTYLAIHYAIETIPPFLMAGLRYLIAGPILYVWLRLRGAPAPTKIHWRSALIVGAFLLGGGNGGVVWGEQTVPSGLAALMVAVVPLWILIFDWIRPHGPKPKSVTIAGLILGIFGIALLANPRQWDGAVPVAGLIALLISPVLWGYGSVYARRAPLPESPFMATAQEMIMGGLVLLIMSAVTGELNGFSVAAVSQVSWIGLIYLAIFGALVGFTAYVFLLKNAPLNLTATYAFVNPIVAVFLGWLFAQEEITKMTLVAGGFIVLSVALISRE